MSLLLDALKRAEAAKRSKPTDGTMTAEEVITPLDSGTPASSAAATPSSTGAPIWGELSLEPAENETNSTNAIKPATGASHFEALAAEDDAISGVKPTRSMPRSASAAHTSKSVSARPPFAGRDGKKVAPKDASRTSAEDDVVNGEVSVSATDTQAQRIAAQNVFTVKQRAVLRQRPVWLPPLIALVLVIAIVGGWVVWHQLIKVTRSGSSPQPLSATTPTITPTPSSSPVPTQPVAVNPELVSKPSEVIIAESTLPPLLPPALLATSRESQAAPVRQVPRPLRTPRQSADQDGSITLGQSGTAKPPRFARQIADRTTHLQLRASDGPATRPVAPALLEAYAALVAGDYPRAHQLYTIQTEANPNSTDVWLGHATAAARMGEGTVAARSYARVLEIDPTNVLARNGLLTLQGSATLLETESQIRNLLARDPNSAPLHFALGNALASDRRWSEAQQSYFEAVRLDAKNADYLYNLAVSLDQLRQNKLAIDYYRRALATLASGQRTQFDRQAVERRITELERAP